MSPGRTGRGAIGGDPGPIRCLPCLLEEPKNGKRKIHLRTLQTHQDKTPGESQQLVQPGPAGVEQKKNRTRQTLLADRGLTVPLKSPRSGGSGTDQTSHSNMGRGMNKARAGIHIFLPSGSVWVRGWLLWGWIGFWCCPGALVLHSTVYASRDFPAIWFFVCVFLFFLGPCLFGRLGKDGDRANLNAQCWWVHQSTFAILRGVRRL